MYSFYRKEQKLNSISQRRVEDNFGKWYFILLLTHCNCEFISNIQVDGEVRGGVIFHILGIFETSLCTNPRYYKSMAEIHSLDLVVNL